MRKIRLHMIQSWFNIHGNQVMKTLITGDNLKLFDLES